MRSLPPGAENRPLNTYEVVKPFDVDAGRAAPWFNQPGLGVQYDLGTRTVQEMVDLGYVVFNLLVCNVDSHAKNYSLLFADSSPRLAPIYDVMCGRVYEGITENLPQKIAGHNRGDQILGRHWVRMAREVGLAPAATRRRIGALAERVRAALGPLSGQCRKETPAAGILDEIAARIDARCRRVIGNLEILEGAEEGEGGPQDVG